MSDGAQLTAVGTLAAAAAFAGIALLRRPAIRRRLLDHPNARSSHTVPTPRGGGAALVLAVSAGVLGLSVFDASVWRAVIATAVLLALVGLADDLRGLSARLRLMIQLLIAAATIAVTGPFLTSSPCASVTTVVACAIAIAWVAGFTNAFNFMDGIDGMAGAQALVGGAAWVLIGIRLGDTAMATLGALLGGASLGFLGHNWPPARIFLGDVGSMFLGFLFAMLPVVASQQAPGLALGGVLIVWPFVFDSAFTLARRWRGGERLMDAHRSHLYQRYVIAGASHRRATVVYAALAGACALAAPPLLDAGARGVAIALTALAACAAVQWHLVTAMERQARAGRSVN